MFLIPRFNIIITRAATSEKFRGDVQSTMMQLFCYEQLTNIGGGTFFIVGAMGVCRGGNGHLLPRIIGIRTKMSRKPEVNSLLPILTEFIHAMPVYIPV